MSLLTAAFHLGEPVPGVLVLRILTHCHGFLGNLMEISYCEQNVLFFCGEISNVCLEGGLLSSGAKA